MRLVVGRFDPSVAARAAALREVIETLEQRLTSD